VQQSSSSSRHPQCSLRDVDGSRGRVSRCSTNRQDLEDLACDERNGDGPSKRPNRRRALLRWSASSALVTSGWLWGGGIRRDDFVPANAVASAFDVGGGGGAAAAAAPDAAEVPFRSVRKHKTVRLFNGLPVLLVSDRLVSKATVALAVAGAGQFSDPPNLMGAAHLLEHMLLSFRSTSLFRGSRDFEEWLEDDPLGNGASNGFTAYDKVCFHYSCSSSSLGEAMDRFAGLFRADDVAEICRDNAALKREVRRVDSELDTTDPDTQAYYLLKAFCTPDHPYSRFSMGSIDTLERRPKKDGVDVGEQLLSFFQNHYLPSRSVLVVVAPQELVQLERIVAPFASTLSRAKPPGVASATVPPMGRTLQLTYPGGFLQVNRLKHVVLYRTQAAGGGRYNDRADAVEKMYINWSLHLDYRGGGGGGSETASKGGRSTSAPGVTATQVAFVMSQVLGRRGPGSLSAFLRRRGWTLPGPNSAPRVLVPLDVSGFQILRLEIPLTVDGFINRSAVLAAVYDALGAAAAVDRSSVLSPDALTTTLLAQHAAIAQLHAYELAQRPPDAVELAVDALQHGLGPDSGVASGQWCRFPTPTDRPSLELLRKAALASIDQMCDYDNAVVIVTAGNDALSRSASAFEEQVPPLSSPRWLMEPVTGARFCFVDMLPLPSRLEEIVLTKIVDSEELLPPLLNPLVPGSIRKPRRRTLPSVDPLVDRPNEKIVYPTAIEGSTTFRRSSSSYVEDDGLWRVLLPIVYQTGIPMPRGPPEATCRCAFVFQLLSSRPARATVRQAAHAELWKLSFVDSVSDLAELGAPGGLAYDVSFNKFGMRLAFLGPSQMLPSYARRICRRLMEHPVRLLEGPEMLPVAIKAGAVSVARRQPGITQRRKRIISNLRSARAVDAAAEGIAFLKSCAGAVAFAQGDLLPEEVDDLLRALKDIVREAPAGMSSAGLGARPAPSAVPTINDLVYNAQWKPRNASPWTLPGMTLMSDACGRVPR
jgi:insulysin